MESNIELFEEVKKHENKDEGSTKPKLYIPIKYKFIISLIISILWVIFSYYVSKQWISDLSQVTYSVYLAIFIIGGIAYIPGFMNAFLVCSLLLDKQPKFKVISPRDEVTILVAAYNEEVGIFNTLKYIKEQEYKGKIHTIVINNNSNDNTCAEVERAKQEMGMDILLLHENTPGKFNALNHGLKYVKTRYVITLDADTLIYNKAVNYLISRANSAPDDVCAVAGSMLVRNSRDNLLARTQEWDYFLSIASIKRMQGNITVV